MDNCCDEIQGIKCSVNDINQRIIPIEYINDVLVVDSPLSVQTLYAENLDFSTIQLEGDIIPTANTAYDLGSTTNWFDNIYVNEVHTSGGSVYVENARITATGDVLELPVKTTISGYPPFNTEYFDFFSTSLTFPSGRWIIVGSSSVAASANTNCFSFVASQDCIISSMLFSFAVGSPSTITNASAFLYVLDQTGGLYYTGKSVSIASSPAFSKRYAETTFEYKLYKGDSLGVYVQYTGSSTNTTPTVVVGYKKVPPTPVLTSHLLGFLGNSRVLSGHYHSNVAIAEDPYAEEEVLKSENSVVLKDEMRQSPYGRAPMSYEDFIPPQEGSSSSPSL